MMVVTVGGFVVFAADIDDGVAGRKKGGIARADEFRGFVGGEQAKEVDGESFVRVKLAVVRADQRC